MKILIIQEKGRNKENEDFREALNMKRALNRIPGTEAIVFGLRYHTLPFHQLEDQCDAILLLENYPTGDWLPDISSSKKPKIFWSIDSHCVLHNHIAMCHRFKIDLVLNSTRSYIQDFENNGIRSVWFPNCYPSDLIGPRDCPKSGVGFCGNIVNRGEYISKLMNDVGMKFDQMIIGERMVRAVNSYAIGWNRNMRNDINYRTFETMGCRTFLLTNFTDGLDELFDIGKHLITYDTYGDCVDKIRYYLNHESERETIASAGHEHVRVHHTFDTRARQFIDLIKGL